MSKGRKTTKLITEEISREDADQIFAAYAKADAEKQKLQAHMDLKITKIREQYQDALLHLEEQKEEQFRQLQHFAQNNDDLFAKRKSLEFAHGVIGFRTGTPSLKAKKGFTWAAVLELVREHAPQFVRVKEDVNKEAIIAERNQDEVQAIMTKIHVEVKQDESFYVEPKKESAVA